LAVLDAMDQTAAQRLVWREGSTALRHGHAAATSANLIVSAARPTACGVAIASIRQRECL
jgi:hypothetical protein